MAIRKLWAVYAKQETTYADNTYASVGAGDFLLVFSDTVEVNTESETAKYPYDPTKIVKTGKVYETQRTVSFSFEMPIRWTGTVNSIENILLAASMKKTGTSAPFVFTPDTQKKSLAMRFIADNKHEIVTNGVVIEEIRFRVKPGDLLIAKVSGKGLFVSETLASSGLAPTVDNTGLVRCTSTSVSGDLAANITEAEFILKNNLHLAVDITKSYVASRFYITGMEITGSFKALSDALGSKYAGDSANINITLGNVSFAFTEATYQKRELAYMDDIEYFDLTFEAPTITITFSA